MREQMLKMKPQHRKQGNREHVLYVQCTVSLEKLVTEKPVDFVGFDNVVEFNKNRQNDDNVVKAYKGLFS